jgi:hypothetical protein
MSGRILLNSSAFLMLTAAESKLPASNAANPYQSIVLKSFSLSISCRTSGSLQKSFSARRNGAYHLASTLYGFGNMLNLKEKYPSQE